MYIEIYGRSYNMYCLSIISCHIVLCLVTYIMLRVWSIIKLHHTLHVTLRNITYDKRNSPDMCIHNHTYTHIRTICTHAHAHTHHLLDECSHGAHATLLQKTSWKFLRIHWFPSRLRCHCAHKKYNIKYMKSAWIFIAIIDSSTVVKRIINRSYPRKSKYSAWKKGKRYIPSKGN